ncbi:hypothetical protein V6N12_012515 [Hibiscus sabdariffa]|uniref:Major facilitator superfamily protein n=1 Tax=Hibiscus sabdariffa TaxID=183260 RepID=A0ABR2ARK4_9ROSI
MEAFYMMVFGALASLVAALELTQSSKDRISTSSAFHSFKNSYLLVYSLMMGAICLLPLQSLWIWKGEIGHLFIAGFGSSMLFGTVVGSLADKRGRKRACVTYCIAYILSCITKHSPQYKVLMLGRVLGGIATSLLSQLSNLGLLQNTTRCAFATLELTFGFLCNRLCSFCACICYGNCLNSEILLQFWILQRGFDQQWLSITFAKAIFLGNGLMAILSGLFGNVLVDSLKLGPVAPFDAASCFLAIGMINILSTWTENYGDPSENKDLVTQFKGAAAAIAAGESEFSLLNILSTCFYALVKSKGQVLENFYARPWLTLNA